MYEKTILVSTLFGLPMFSLDLQGDPTTTSPLTQVDLSGLAPVSGGPGAATGLESADISVAPSLIQRTDVFTNVVDNSLIPVTYYEGDDGFSTRSGFPILPVSFYDVSHPNGLNDGVLRGVGFRGGTFSRETNIVPLTSGAVTELAGPHEMFRSNFFYPTKPWSVNYYDVLIGGDNGTTRLMVSPLQFRSTNANSFTGTYLKYSGLDFRLYYNADLGAAALAGAPSLAKGRATTVSPNQIDFEMIGTEPISGVQEVWITWTDTASAGSGVWQSLDLAQSDPDDETLWTGSLILPAGVLPQNVRYLVQATNAVGLVTLQNNDGQFYEPDVDPGALTGTGENLDPVSLVFVSPPTSGNYATNVTLTANLTSNGSPLADELINFSLGDLSGSALTDENGDASITLNLVTTPADYQLQAAYGGSLDYEEALVQAPFTLNKQPTSLTTSIPSTTIVQGDEWNLNVTLTDSLNRAIPERFIFFNIGNGFVQNALDTNVNGQVELDEVDLPPGTYAVDISFAGDEDYEPSVASLSVTVEPSNVPPVANDLDIFVDEDVLSIIDVTNSISDADGNLDLSSILITAGPVTAATLVNNGDGTFFYTSELNFQWF